MRDQSGSVFLVYGAHFGGHGRAGLRVSLMMGTVLSMVIGCRGREECGGSDKS